MESIYPLRELRCDDDSDDSDNEDDQVNNENTGKGANS